MTAIVSNDPCEKKHVDTHACCATLTFVGVLGDIQRMHHINQAIDQLTTAKTLMRLGDTQAAERALRVAQQALNSVTKESDETRHKRGDKPLLNN